MKSLPGPASILAFTLLIAARVVALEGVQQEVDPLNEALWTAVQPALPYPAAQDDDTPVNGKAEPRWVVRRFGGHDGPLIEVVANPLNPENQARAERAMREIQKSVAEAERRAQAEYERALGTTSRQVPARELSGISLDDEGVAGDRADWDAKLVIALRTNAERYEWRLDGSGSLSTRPLAGGAIAAFAEAAEYEQPGGLGRRYRPAEARVYVGEKSWTLLGPSETPMQGRGVEVRSAAPERALEVTLRGNSELLKEVLAKSDWSGLARLVP